MSKNNIAFAILFLVIIIQGAVLIFGKSDTIKITEPFDDTELRNQIKVAEESAAQWEQRALDYQEQRDTITIIETKIKHHYHEVYKFIPVSTDTQLDSTIRANL